MAQGTLNLEFSIDDFKKLYPHSFEKLCESFKAFGDVILIKLYFFFRRPYGFLLYFSHDDEYIEKKYYVSIADLNNYEDDLEERNNE